MSQVLDINVDMGESYGRWSLGDDAGIMPYISSASIACGFHAGDPVNMRKTVELAVEHELEIGAHVALPDILGFGRRRMTVSPDELKDYCTYQIGALKAFVEAAGGRLGHVKPHGALYVMYSEDEALASAVAEATAEIDRSLLLLALSDKTRPAVEKHGIRLVKEAFVDLHYDAEGHLLLERVKQAWDPELVADRVIRLVQEQKIQSVEGTDIELTSPTICLHGDAPNAVEVARTVKERLQAAGIRLAPLVETLRERVH